MTKRVDDLEDEFSEDELFTPQPPRRAAAPQGGGNPLAKYFRMPGVHIALPTKGAFYPPGMIEFTDSHELPVLPMRAADEILMKSPDALMSGYALEKLIESCVPSIKNPKLVSTPDLDVLLLAIRVASYGNKMGVETTCPKCKTENSFDCDLPSIIASMTDVPSEISVRLTSEIVAYLRPFNLKNATKMSLIAFEQTRKLQSLDLGAEEATRIRSINESYDTLTKENVAAAADCVIKVVVPEGAVTDKKSISEFIMGAPSDFINKIDDKLREINALGIDRRIKVKCPNEECGHDWESEIQFDPTTFFARGS
jgi:hypothetical protein